MLIKVILLLQKIVYPIVTLEQAKVARLYQKRIKVTHYYLGLNFKLEKKLPTRKFPGKITEQKTFA